MKFADDYKPGQKFDLGSYEVSRDEIIAFAAKYDPQPYHLNESQGHESPFGGLVASGWNTASIWMRLYVLNMLDGACVYGSPGVDELRWHEPVRPGDILLARVEILGIVPSLTDPDVVTIRKKGTLSLSGAARPHCSLVLHSRFGKRSQIEKGGS